MSNLYEKTFCKYCKSPINPASDQELINNCHKTCQSEYQEFHNETQDEYQLHKFMELYQDLLSYDREITLHEKEFYMWKIGLEFLSDSIGCFKELELLELDENKLTDLPTTLPANLQFLSLSENNFTQIPAIIFSLNLDSLYMNGNQLTEIPSAIGKLTSLEYLSFARNPLKKISDDLYKLPSIKEFDLSDTNLQVFPKGLIHLENLCGLYLAKNNLRTIPPEFGDIDSLCRVDLSENHLTSLPKEFGKSKHFITCHLNDNELEDLPDSLGDLPLIELDLSNNRFKKFPQCVTRPPLWTITYNNMALDEIPVELMKESITGLEFENCGLKRLPDEIDKCIKLSVISVPENDLTELPETVGNLRDLRTLDVRNNPLRKLPEDLWKTGMFNLFANGTKLEQLPPNFGRSKIIDNIYLQGSRIKELPDFNPLNDRTKKIQVLDIRDTPLVEVPESIGNVAIQNVYVSNQTLEEKFRQYKNIRWVKFSTPDMKTRFEPVITKRFK